MELNTIKAYANNTTTASYEQTRVAEVPRCSPVILSMTS